MIPNILFYLFSFVMLTSALLVVSARNPVHAVLFLVLAFFNAAGLFVLLGAEFLAFILVIVYVGAVAVLFLFVVMMLDINFTKLRVGVRKYLAMGGAVALVLVAELITTVWGWSMDPKVFTNASEAATPDAGAVENTRAIGQLLYTTYFFPFQVSGLILLVAMIGAIVLTLRHKKDARRQRVAQQLNRPLNEIIEVVKIKPGQGVEI